MKKRLIFCLTLILTCLLSTAYALEKEEDAFFLAANSYQDESYLDTIILSERFIRLFPASAKRFEAQLYIGKSYFNLNKLKESETAFKQIVNQDTVYVESQRTQAILWLGKVALKGKNFEEADVYFKYLLSGLLKADNVTREKAVIYLNELYLETNRYLAAINNFLKFNGLLNNIRTVKSVSLKISKFLYRTKNFSELKSFIQKLYAKYPALETPDFNFYLAESLYYSSDYARAKDIYNKTIKEITDKDARDTINLALGWISLQLKDFKSAFEYFDKVQNRTSARTNSNLKMGLSELYYFTQNYEKSLSLLDQLIAENYASKDIAYKADLMKARVYFELGQHKDAIANLEIIISDKKNLIDAPVLLE